MVYISYAKIPEKIETQELFERASSSFGHPRNSDHFGEIMARRNEQSRRESLSALLLLSMLAGKAGCDTNSLILSRSNNGKPYFLDSPLHFSLTHSKGYAAAALSDISCVGLDLECSAIDNEKAELLAVRWFYEYEAAALFDKREDFVRIWTKKEAYAKMEDIPLAELLSEKMQDYAHDRKSISFSYFEVYGFPLTLCSREKDGNIVFFETRL